MYEKLRNAKYVSTLDLKNGYWNAGLTENSKHLTAFSTEYGTWEYNVVPQGLICSAAHFQKWVETKLRRHGILFEHVSVNKNLSTGIDASSLFDEKGHYIGTAPIGIAKIQGESGFVAVYIDDLIIFSDSYDDHQKHLLKVMQVCSDEKLYLNNKKSHFFTKYTRYLGAVCGNQRILMDPLKVEAIMKMPTPKGSQTQIREFLGNCSFYRRWIDSYAKISSPLNELLRDEAKGKTTLLWDANPEKYDQAVHSLKKALCSFPVLRQPNFEKPFLVYTDASDYALGAVLCQLIDNKMCAIHYVARSLQKAEKNYSVQEKEALGIIFGVKKFRKMLLGSRFKIRCLTDHKSLECLTNAKELAGRMSRWAMIMSEYNYTVEYIKGTTNTAADALSRLISLPEDAWKPLSLKDMDDTDHEHPFLLLWPDVRLLLVAHQYCASAASVISSEDSHNDLNRPGCLFLDTGNCKNYLTEDKLNDPNSDLEPHERVLFSRKSVYTGDLKVLNIHKELYTHCDEFKLLYHYLNDKRTEKTSEILVNTKSSAKDHDTTSTSRPTKKSKSKSSSGKKPTEKNTRTYKCADGQVINITELLSHFDVAKFMIDPVSDLLYFINSDGCETLCVPNVKDGSGESIRYHLFLEMHDSLFYGHRGANATYAHMRSKMYWPKLLKDIRKYILSCNECQNNKIDRQKPKGLLMPVQKPTLPGQSYNMDFMTDLPKALYMGQTYDTAWIFVDRCSHRVYSILCRKNHTAEELFDLFLHQIVLRQANGIPLELISDRDKIFTSNFFKECTARLGISLRLSSARSQQTNGKAERMIAVLEEVLRNGINYKQDNWAELLDYALLAVNDTPNPNLQGRSPLFYERGFDPVKPIDLISSLNIKGRKEKCPPGVAARLEYLDHMRISVRDAIYEAERTYNKYYDAKRQHNDTIKVGSMVRLNLDHINLELFRNRRSKLNPLWFGPFRVTAQPSPVSFTLELPEDCKIHETFHVSRLKVSTDVAFSKILTKRIEIPTDKDLNDIDYEVEKILDHHHHKQSDKYSYLIKWKGYSEIFHSRWEPREHLVGGCDRILQDYDLQNEITVQRSSKRSRRGGA